MTILEFIRRNSILVIIVIVGVGAGLVMMDYAGKGSAFSRDFYIKVNGVGYDYQETLALGENGKQFISSLMQATRRMVDQFDKDEDGQFNEEESAALQAWQNDHPEFGEFYELIHEIYSMWGYGVARDEVNVAIARAALKETANTLGLHPSEAQIDSYLRSMPPFRQEDGSFNIELYQRLAGYRHGVANRKQEEIFRDVVADMIIWESLHAMLAEGVSFNTRAQLGQINAYMQQVSGRTAWLPAGAVPTPAEPTEEELHAFWEEHKDAYKSDERRIVSVYTLSPTKDSNMETLLTTVDLLMQDLSLANGQGLDKLLTDAANNPEYEPFNYQIEDGSTHRTYPLSTCEELRQVLQDEVNYDGVDSALAQVAFSEVTDAPEVETYSAAVENGTAEKLVTIKQIRGPYTTKNDEIKLLRVEAIQAPTTLSFEEARNKALADMRAERAAQALQTAAEKLYSEMQATIAEQGMPAAFTMAAEAGAEVQTYGPLKLADVTATPPSGVSIASLLSTHSGKLTPLVVQENGARITSVDKRTIEDTPDFTMQKTLYHLPAENMRLRRSLMQDWLNSAYDLYQVQLAPTAVNRGGNEPE